MLIPKEELMSWARRWAWCSIWVATGSLDVNLEYLEVRFLEVMSLSPNDGLWQSCGNLETTLDRDTIFFWKLR